MNKTRAFACWLYDEETEQEWPHSDYVFFGTWSEIEKHDLEQSRFYTNREERPTQLGYSEIEDDDIAYELWKFTRHHDSEWRPGGVIPARIKWLSLGTNWRDVQRAINDKYDATVDADYCERLLPLIQKHYMDVYP